MSKSRKSISTWMCCDKCQSTLMQKDVSAHETNCPPLHNKSSHSYVRDSILYSTLEVYAKQELPKNISEHEASNIVFISQSAMQLCEIPIGDPVIITTEANTIVKLAWPTNDNNLLGISMTKKALESSQVSGLVKVKKLTTDVYVAREIFIVHTGKQALSKTTPKLDVLIKNYNERRIFCVGNRITVPYYGKNLGFKIVNINADESASKKRKNDLAENLKKMHITDDKANVSKLYEALYSTKWRIQSSPDEENIQPKAKTTIYDIGGYETLIEKLRDVVDEVLGKRRRIKGSDIANGVLLYGTAGVGKSIIANAVLAEYSAEIFHVNTWELQSKVVAETEQRLNDLFTNAIKNAPSIIFIENIDTRKNNDNERGMYASLVKQLDDLRLRDVNVLVLATASRPDLIESSLRRPGRLGKELEVCTPTPPMRREILKKFLAKVPHELSEKDIDRIAMTTHGFVGVDLYGLCSEAGSCASKRYSINENDRADQTEITMNFDDFNKALTIVKPSAMKEVIVEVPNVRWTDVGGQQGLKLKLQQAVEWPLKHPEAFTRLGITPPRGLLMFGPPGCSKTMIAKALATESKLNFLNIKGPELFSKWVGESERAVRQVFQKARQVAPSIIFIDEIDALGGERGSSSSTGGSNVQERVLAQLLTELDGITALGNVALVAATNRPDRIDKALLRAGRLDRIVYVPLPDAETRKDIFEIKLRKMPKSEDVKIDDLVELTEGYSGAEVQAICNEAAMKALEESIDAKTITKEHFQAALSIVTPRTPMSLIKLYEDYMNSHKC